MADKYKSISKKPASAKAKLQAAIKKLSLTRGVNAAFTKFLELMATSEEAAV